VGSATLGGVGEHVLVGPTNTGKTHRAIERMLDFESGMIGLPLRVFSRAMLATSRLALRRALTRLVDPGVDAIKSALEQSAAASGLPALASATFLRLGFVPLGRWIVRCDVLELLRAARREHADEAELRARVQLLLGADAHAGEQIVRALGGAKRRAAGAPPG
jgi:hypothetical protein